MVPDSQAINLKGHSSNVTSVKFGAFYDERDRNIDSEQRAFTGGYLFSAGGNDTTLIQWKLEA